jgi:hypothetical protein
MVCPSYVEVASDDLLAELRTISKENGYRNDIKGISRTFIPIEQVTDFPHVMCLFNNGYVESINDPRITFDEHVEVFLSGYVSGEAVSVDADSPLWVAGESLVHDFKKLAAKLISKYLNSRLHKWNIEGKPGSQKGYMNIFQIQRQLPVYQQKSKGAVEMSFMIHIRGENGTFAPDCDAFIADIDRTDTKDMSGSEDA